MGINLGDTLTVVEGNGHRKITRSCIVEKIYPRFFVVDYGDYLGSIDIFDLQRGAIKIIKNGERVEFEKPKNWKTWKDRHWEGRPKKLKALI